VDHRPKLPIPRPGQISPERKWIYYTGLTLSAIGLVSFLSTFVTFAMHFGDFSNFEGNARSDFLRAVVGMILMIAGGAVTTIGARGASGSGLLLDPERASRDLEPFARMSGRLKDAEFSEMHTVRETLGSLAGQGGAAPPEVKVRCRGCQALNDEDARYCGQCGARI
jgi:hypothetical protein